MRWRKRPGHQGLKDVEALNKTHTTTELTSQVAVSHEVIARLTFSEMVLRQLPEFVFDPSNPMRQCIAPQATGKIRTLCRIMNSSLHMKAAAWDAASAHR